ncbi:hypothetical protein NQT62_02925 [Limnobacter humi]|uniref:SPOR domain-containing protein n=1 Tax=Limnobacter humi TaxID=1778671 RepID=A0ABT1WCZ7_9BURK|nr:hypothetical protein [Limnobacter humi]MCQ8895390.1 hypothetical protein [Limnobacter humi]
MILKPERRGPLWLIALTAANLSLLAWGASSWLVPGDSLVDAGWRSDWVQIEKPWEISVAPTAAKAPKPKIDVVQSQRELDSAIEAAAQTPQLVPVMQVCRLWGPFVPNEADRIADALKTWPGQTRRTEREMPIGYVVYLPKAEVDRGLGLSQLAAKGVREMFYISAPGPMQGTISLGLFRDLTRARQQQADLVGKGVAGVEIRERLGPKRVYFELRGTAVQAGALRRVYELNPKGDLQDCPVPSAP